MDHEQTVIYHADCTDGFTAAWVAHKNWPNAEFIAARYGDEVPNVCNRDVLVLDFSYDRETVKRMSNQAHSFWLIDHHQTSAQELKDVPYCLINQECSGASLAWRHLMHGRRGPLEMPELVEYVEDRDLWRWALPQSQAVSAAIQSYEHTFEQWDLLEQMPVEELATEGKAILRYQRSLIERIVKDSYIGLIAGHMVRIVNTPMLQSEVGHELAERSWFAASYFLQDGKWKFSLRSRENGADVAEIAQRYGGGGHKHAAGFVLDAEGAPIRGLL